MITDHHIVAVYSSLHCRGAVFHAEGHMIHQETPDYVRLKHVRLKLLGLTIAYIDPMLWPITLVSLSLLAHLVECSNSTLQIAQLVHICDQFIVPYLFPVCIMLL
jgi:hypothetical protein